MIVQLLKDVDVMDDMIYNSLEKYFHALELKGYISWPDIEKLLILIFFRDFAYRDYRGILSLEDYRMIERALECLYGSTCLIPYPDYMKKGRLYLGQISEVVQRLKAIEDISVLKLLKSLHSEEGSIDSDVMVLQDDSE